MKRFVRNDNGLYNMTKRQSTFLCIMTGYRKVTRVLPKGYKSYKIVISISLWTLGECLPGWCGCMSSVALSVSVCVQRSCVWGAGSCVRRRRQLRFNGSRA